MRAVLCRRIRYTLVSAISNPSLIHRSQTKAPVSNLKRSAQLFVEQDERLAAA